MVGALTDALAWASVLAFVAGALVARRRRDLGRPVLAGAWALFGVFWAPLVGHFWLVQKSAIEGIATAVAVPACLYTGLLLLRGRESLFVLSRAVAVMGLLYLPFETVTLLEHWLIEVVTRQVEFAITAIGYDPVVTTDAEGVRNTFLFTGPDGHRYRTYIVLACSGIGSMVMFAGLIAAVRAPLGQKLRALAVSVPVIWVLNILRNVFIAVAFGRQWFRGLTDPAALVFGFSDPGLASFYVADRVIAQSLAVVVLVAILWAVVRQVPALVVVVEDVVYLLTRREYDLAGAFGTASSTVDGTAGLRTDGGGPDTGDGNGRDR
jgi:archaeosortase A (PGF-CTERM-specific)